MAVRRGDDGEGSGGPTPDEQAEPFDRMYAAGTAPWDSGMVSQELVRVIEAGRFRGRSVLEMGCGTGTNAIELARRGFQVTAIDWAVRAVRRAREKARSAGVTIDFRVGDIVRTELEGPYDLLFDRGLYHGIRRYDLEGFLARLCRETRTGTRWLCLAGNAREISPIGPPVVSEEELRTELEPDFQILDVREFRFDLRVEAQPLAWSILLERR